jgi:Copper type II ascorbate-dependent monooxygenase, C-terminal domain/Copper type II ascorbate-dependent monooxygenase, N-terminal domain
MNDRPSGGAATGATGSGTSAGTGGGGGGDWCQVQAILRDNCQECHGAQPLFGAPMPLVTFDNLHAHAVTNPSLFVYEMVGRRIHDDKNPMPPPTTNRRLATQDAAVVDAWIAAGAPAGDDPSCSGTTSTTGAGGSGDTGSTSVTGAGGMTGAGGGAGSAGSTGAGGAAGAGGSTGAGGSMQPPVGWPADCEQRYKVLAHGKSQVGDTSKFNVSGAPQNQFYQCFFFKVPYGTDVVQALQFSPIIDDARVVHHWILYGSDTATGTDGQVGGTGCSNGAFLAGWAPGGRATNLPPDVGLQMPKGAGAMLALEIHYNNVAGYTDANDASGVEFCTTKTFRPNTAAVHWLGSQAISVLPHQTKDVVGTCDPTSTQPVHVLSESPHMHQIGVHAKLVLNRKDGTQQVLHDKPFSFADQQSYPIDVIVNDGDTFTTTCTYDNTTNGLVIFGPNTENEMCYNFVTAYPAGGLSGPMGANHCLGR